MRSYSNISKSRTITVPGVLMHKDLPENPVPFTIPVKGNFGIDDSERCIEIPWALSLYAGEPIVLEVGYAHAEDRYISALRSLCIPHLHGIDLVKRNIEGIIPHAMDIRKTTFPDNYFDMVFCISTLEHIGRDVSRYTRTAGEKQNDGDLKALREIVRITKNKGKIVLTIPYGREGDYGWLIHYNEDRLRWLVRSLPLQVKIEEYFIFSGGWRRCDKHELDTIGYQDNHAQAAAGLACLLLVKTGEPALKTTDTGSGPLLREGNATSIKEIPGNHGRSEMMADNQDISSKGTGEEERKESNNPATPSDGIPAGRETEDEFISQYLEYLNRTWDIQNDPYLITSHQPVIGSVLVRGRQLVNSEVRRYIDPVILQQIEFNANTVRILNWMVQRIGDLELQLAEQKKASSQEKQPDLPSKK
jgi:O-antigen chain-terminating methyltransferase